jgi:hypothetical protein
MRALFLIPLLFLTSCTFDSYSSKRAARIWGDEMDKATKDATRTCFAISSNQNPPMGVRCVNAVFSMADSIPYGGLVYKVLDPKNLDADRGYMLYAKDTTSGQNIWRLVIYEKSKQDFNDYCRQTPFYDFEVK